MSDLEPAAESNTRKIWLAAEIGRNPRLLQRIAYYYGRLQRLSRAKRRRLAQHAAVSLAGAALLLAIGSRPAHASNITVADGKVVILEDNICSLSEAIANAMDTSNGLPYDDCAAGNPSGPDNVVLPAGGSFVISDYLAEYSYYGYAGLPNITSAVTIEGNGATIRRESADEFRLLNVAESGDLTINNTTLADGFVSYGYGGAIFSYGKLAVNGATLSGNTAYTGGGIYSFEGDVTISNSTFSNNTASGGAAVAMFYGHLTVSDSTISGNDSPELDGNGGGGFYLVGVEAEISKTVVNGNYNALAGGGIRAETSTITLEQVDINDNSVGASGYGGGLFLLDSNMTVRNATISGNNAPAFGGGAFMYGGELLVDRSLIAGNMTEGEGGGLSLDNSFISIGEVELVNSTLSGNAAESGGAISNKAEIILTNVTATGNSANNGDGGAILNLPGGTVTLQQSLVAGNQATGFGREIENAGSAVAHGANLFGFNGSSGLDGLPVSADAIVPPGPLNTILNPTLAGNGGPTDTHALPMGSPAIDQVANSACAAAPANGVDQRGNLRGQDGDGNVGPEDCDIGAYEKSDMLITPTPSATVTPGPSPTATPSAELPYKVYLPMGTTSTP